MTIPRSGRGVARAFLVALCAVLLAGHATAVAAHPQHQLGETWHGKPPPPAPPPRPPASTEHSAQGQGPAPQHAATGQHQDGAHGNSQHGQNADQQGSTAGGPQDENSQGRQGQGDGAQGRADHQDPSQGKAAHEDGRQADSQGQATRGGSHEAQNAAQQDPLLADSQDANSREKGAHSGSQGKGTHEHGKNSHGRPSSSTPQAAPATATPPPIKDSSPASTQVTSTTAPSTSPAAAPAKTTAAKGQRHGARHRTARRHAKASRPDRTRTSPSRLTSTVHTAAIAVTHARDPVGKARHQRQPVRSKSESSNPLSGIGGDIPLPLPVPDWSKPIILLLLLLSGGLALRSVLIARRARRLEGQRVELQHELDVMQAALVPAVPQRLGDLAVSVAYRPASGPAAGGDFYDLFMLAPGKVAIVLGDVAGHGEEALTHAALTRYTLRAYLQAGLQPRAALAVAGRVLADPESERFATVAVGVFAARSAELTYALAGHHPPILSGTHMREPIASCASPPVGWGAATGRRQTVLSLPAGSEVCFFSDGLIEARYEGGLLGRERLGEILASLGSRPQATQLLERVRGEAQATPDDMVACVLAPQRATLGEPVHIEELLADSRSLAGEEVRRFLRECRLPVDEIQRTIENARAVAASSGEALLRVALAARASTVSILSSPDAQGAARPAQREAEQGLLQTLPAG